MTNWNDATERCDVQVSILLSSSRRNSTGGKGGNLFSLFSFTQFCASLARQLGGQLVTSYSTGRLVMGT